VVDNNTTTNYTPNTVNQYTGVGGTNNVTNDNEHAISAYNNVTYTYINDGRLSSAASGGNTYTLSYDALDRCVKRTLNTTTTYYIYDGEKPIVEYDANGTSVGVNVYGKGIDEILERVAIGTDNQWHSYFLQQNHEGSVTHLTDASGNVIEKYRYDAFGVPTIYDANWTVRSSTSYDNRFLFTGREYAATYRSTNTGLNFYEYRARAYHPGLGRFMSEDPKLFGAGDYNLFRYCHNDPLDMTDPMGLAGEATGLLQSGTHDRVWDMTKWFDRSNILQGNFVGFAALSGQSDRDAKGALSATQTKARLIDLRSLEHIRTSKGNDLPVIRDRDIADKWDAVESVPPADYFRWRENQTGKLRLSGGVLCIVPSQRISPAHFLRVSSMRAVNWASVYSSSDNLPAGFWPSRRNVRPFCVYVPLTRPVGPNRNRNVASEDPT
jgi:RHS repeat-associated protein